MTKRVLILGGYGNFGARIMALLAHDADLQVIIAGRSERKARALAAQYQTIANPPEVYAFDILSGMAQALVETKPDIVIHTSGPFQEQGYAVAEACIEAGCHYIDLGDGRDFVSGIGTLHDKAQARGVSIISGASSVPCLSAAIIDYYLPDFSEVERLDYGISTAQRTNPGLATTAAIFGYVGKGFTTRIDGRERTVYGWQGLVRRYYPELGWRLLSYCDVPDLVLFPKRYPQIKTIEFRAGLEVPFLHLGVWALSWCVRSGLVSSVRALARPLYRLAPLCNFLGTERSGFHLTLSGLDKSGQPLTKTFYILTDQSHGPFIPCIPSVLCARLLARGLLMRPGAFPCLDVIHLEAYLDALSGLEIKVITD